MRSRVAMYRVGVDIGGTFTDFVLVDEATGTMRFAKELTTPQDPSRAVDDGVDELLAAHGIEALAICLLHAYANPAHEEQARARVRARHPGLAVSTSAEVFPFMGEYERFTTATMNAYVQPMVDRYLSRL